MNAIITGAGRQSGIGACIAYFLAEQGINVYLTSFDIYDADVGIIRDAHAQISEYGSILRQCQRFGVKAFFRSFDLTSQKNVEVLFDDANSKLGNISILVNNLCTHTFDTFGEIGEVLLESSLAVNTKAVFFLCQEFYRRFQGNYGSIVNMSSTQMLEPLTSEISYAISKAAIPVMVSTLAPIMAEKGITINAVNPGATNVGDEEDKNIDKYRKQNMFGRLGLPSDAANLVSFLVSEKGKWITGQTINSEGGFFRGIIDF